MIPFSFKMLIFSLLSSAQRDREDENERTGTESETWTEKDKFTPVQTGVIY